MIEIANWVANLFILGLGTLFFGIGAMTDRASDFKFLNRNEP